MRFIRSRSASFVQYLLITSSLSTPGSVLNRSACYLNQYRQLTTPMSATKSGVMSLTSECKPITELNFDNRNIQSLPIDTNEVKSVRQVSNAIFSLVEPMPVKSPKLVAYSKSVFEDLLDLRAPIDANDETVLSEYFGGNKVIPDSRPAAHCYCGHQFGNFAGQLGDGATMYLGEVINAKSGKRWELQLKGAGKTPYSRTADGRKVLRSSVREFLCSEAMHFLGVPTTRAGTCVTSDSTVQRDPMYDGGVINERCTIVSRIASNFFRFGSFEIFKPKSDDGDFDGRAGPSAGNAALKQQLLDHILLYYPNIANNPEYSTTTQRYEQMYIEIVRRTAFLVARWQAVGFVHGVLNTDNMSIMGLTIDYGPFGFLEHYDPQYVPNGSDNSARYSYQEQPAMCAWNLGKLAEVLEPLLSRDAAQSALQRYDGLYEGYYQAMMGAKFGFLAEGVATTGDSDDEVVPVGEGRLLSPGDHALVGSFFETLAATSADFTDAFVALTDFVAQLEQAELTAAEVDSLASTLAQKLMSRSASPSSLVQASRRKMRIHRLNMHPAQIEQIHSLLQSAPPAQLSRMFNGAPVDAIREEINGEKRKLDLLVQSAGTVKTYEAMGPAAKQAQDREVWAKWCAQYAARMAEIVAEDRGAATTSSASTSMNKRSAVMRAQNPTFVLRSWLAQDAIKMAEDDADYSGINALLDMLHRPYAPEFSTFLNQSACSVLDKDSAASKEALSSGSGGSELQKRYTSVSPDWADSLICTCSS